MLRKPLVLVGLALMIPVLVLAGSAPSPKAPLRNYPILSGSEPTPPGPVAPVYSLPAIDQVDIIGDTFTLGLTYYDLQHNGTIGRMNTVEPSGWKQFVWMKGENPTNSVRHIWWNGIDPNGVQVFPGNGVAVESSIKGGYTTMDIGTGGRAFPCYHYQTAMTPDGLPWTTTSMDLITHSGAFQDFLPPTTAPVTQILWPKMQISNDQRLHIISTNQIPSGTQAGTPQRMWYISATYDTVPAPALHYDETWTEVDWTQTIAPDVATSPVAGSNKTLWAWTRSREYVTPEPGQTYTQLNNDIYYLIDADGLNPNFSQKVNLTNFIPPDPGQLPDTLKADRDTLRAYNDLSCFIDHNNNAHIAFTTRSYFSIEGTTYWNASIIWHWSEQNPDTFTVIGNYYAFNNNVNCGVWNLKAQRPSLAEDSSGTLYCMYQVYDTDTTHLSLAGWPSGEVYLTKSTDGGMHWAMGINVTNTITPDSAAAGQCLSELCPTMAKRVDNYCHILYILDRDAGTSVQTEGGITLNQVRYHRVPVSLIPSTPLVTNIPFHVGALGVISGPTPVSAPNAFALRQNYPNPFNPTTDITFVLDSPGNVTLDVYNTRGQAVARVLEGTFGPGEHQVTFDGSDLPSGVYFYKLTSGQRTAQQKMTLLK